MRGVLLVVAAMSAMAGAAAGQTALSNADAQSGRKHAPLSIPVRDMPPMSPSQGRRVAPLHHRPMQPANTTQAAGETPTGDAAAQTQFGPNAPTIAGLNFEGNGAGMPGFTISVAPPDNDGAVGRTQYVQLVNAGFTVFDKASNAILAGPTNTNNLWSTLPATNPCNSTNDGDGVVLYDHLADRWIITQFANAFSATGPFYECVAISQTADATGRFFLYYFNFYNTDGVTPLFNDYPKVGVWPDAYYISYNTFTAAGAGVGGMMCALDRVNMLNGAATLRGVPGAAGTPSDSPPNTPAGENQVCFNVTDFGNLPSDLDGSTLPPANSPNYFLEWLNNNHLGMWKFHVDFSTLTNSTLNGIHWVSPYGPTASTILPQTIAVTSFTPTCNWLVTGNSVCVPQCSTANCGAGGTGAGTSQTLDSLSDRLMFRLAYRNFGTHESLLANHSVATSGTTGSGIRWYEIQNPNGTPSVTQTGTWAPDSSYRWMASMAMDKFGNMAVGYSVSSNALRPEIAYAARLSTDAAGTLGNETVLQAGTGTQSGSGLSRWGDYTAMTVDPVDDCTFWYTNQYQATTGAFNWHTRIGSFKLAQCQTTPSNVSVTPDSGAGNAQTFSFLYSDSGGASTITTAQGLFNTSSTTPNSCGFQYNRAANTIQIFLDNGSLNPSPIVLGTAGTLSNSQCSINTGTTTANSAGDSLVVNAVITFTTPGFDGNKAIYMNVSDSNGTTTGLQPMGTWTVQ